MSWKPKKLHIYELQIGQVGASWGNLGRVGACWGKLGQVGQVGASWDNEKGGKQKRNKN